MIFRSASLHLVSIHKKDFFDDEDEEGEEEEEESSEEEEEDFSDEDEEDSFYSMKRKKKREEDDHKVEEEGERGRKMSVKDQKALELRVLEGSGTHDVLSELFGVITTLCRKQFHLILQVFPDHSAIRVARLLIQRVLNDPAFGVHRRIEETLHVLFFNIFLIYI